MKTKTYYSVIIILLLSICAWTNSYANDGKEEIVSYYGSEIDFQLAVNSGSQELTIKAPYNVEGGIVQIISEKGIEVINTILQGNKINISNLAGGTYLLVYTKDGNKVVKSFTK